MLTGDKVLLRAVERGDGPLMHQWLNDLAIRSLQCNAVFPITTASVDRTLQRSGEGMNQVDFAILDKGDNALVGFIHIADLDWVSRNGQMGIIIGDRERHGQGLGGEAITLLTDYAFQTLSLHRIWLRVLAANEKAIGLYEKLGFLQEGVQKDHVFRWGCYHDVILMAKLSTC